MPHDINKNRCLRYFYSFPNDSNVHGALYSGSLYLGHDWFKVQMRDDPTIANVSGSSGVSAQTVSENNWYFTQTGAGLFVTSYTADAEL